ncbi:MAG: 1,4-dihydroxy-6-naphthoate synthase [Desulfobacterium sp.]|nr:1,4-dihydroxy-6-naphthoate synthase [Desulfobacterium sp.]
MSDIKTLSLAFSSCPNDTYIFHAIAAKLVDAPGLDFEITLGDVETLNQAAAQTRFDVTKLSFAALGNLREEYTLLRTGAALGRGCGPLVVAKPETEILPNKKLRVAVPGFSTTACLLFRFFLKERYPGIDPELVAMPFETIMPSVINGESDLGVIIHEGRFVYQTMGLSCITDLGAWWEEQTGLPIPLGCIAIKRGLGAELATRVEDLIKRSILHANETPEAGRSYIKAHAQELDDRVIREHINLYVNDFSSHMGREGEAAIRTFFQKAEQAGLMQSCDQPLFACQGR